MTMKKTFIKMMGEWDRKERGEFFMGGRNIKGGREEDKTAGAKRAQDR